LKALSCEGFATIFICEPSITINSKECRTVAEKDTSNRGFGSMDQERQREIASEGGRAAHEKGSAHEFNSDEAREAGRKGGEAVSSDREHMSEIGRKGGEHSHGGNGGRSMQDDDDSNSGSNRGNTRGGSSEQHAEAGRQSHKNQRDEGDMQQGSHSRGSEKESGEKTRGGSSEQHAQADRQSHKNS
jgi:uncharacterized protein